MADSNITKRALSNALKELTETKPFAKISVGDICQACEMNRKSFYYHFKDKYDLVAWIYDTEFIEVARQKHYRNAWELTDSVCRYFYDNRNFYRKTLHADGQNSFSEYFKGIVTLILEKDIEGTFDDPAAADFFVTFYADAILCAIKRWLSDKNCVPAETFAALLKQCFLGISDRVLREFGEKE